MLSEKCTYYFCSSDVQFIAATPPRTYIELKSNGNCQDEPDAFLEVLREENYVMSKELSADKHVQKRWNRSELNGNNSQESTDSSDCESDNAKHSSQESDLSDGEIEKLLNLDDVLAPKRKRVSSSSSKSNQEDEPLVSKRNQIRKKRRKKEKRSDRDDENTSDDDSDSEDELGSAAPSLDMLQFALDEPQLENRVENGLDDTILSEMLNELRDGNSEDDSPESEDGSVDEVDKVNDGVVVEAIQTTASVSEDGGDNDGCDGNENVVDNPDVKISGNDPGETPAVDENDDAKAGSRTKRKKRASWKNDPLLNGKLLSSSSSGDEFEGILPEKAIKKLEGDKQSKAKQSEEEEVEIKIEKSTREKRVRQRFTSDSFSSDSDFVEEVKVEEDVKKGRKNIRALVSDDNLDLSTQKAAKEEEKRKERLMQRHKNLDSVMQTTQEKGMILDVDENNEPLITVDAALTKRLKTHQQAGVRFMWDSCFESVKRLKVHDGDGCILAHCMGLGKTFQVVTLLHTLFQHPETNIKKVLIICPLSTVLNWKHEFEIGLKEVKTNFPIFVIGDQEKVRSRRLLQVDRWHKQKGVLIMGYEAFQHFVKDKQKVSLKVNMEKIRETLVDPGPDLIVCDEGHLLKNGKNNRTKMLMQVKTKRRIILTGTPMQNNLQECRCIFIFLFPHF